MGVNLYKNLYNVGQLKTKTIRIVRKNYLSFLSQIQKNRNNTKVYRNKKSILNQYKIHN